MDAYPTISAIAPSLCAVAWSTNSLLPAGSGRIVPWPGIAIIDISPESTKTVVSLYHHSYNDGADVRLTSVGGTSLFENVAFKVSNKVSFTSTIVSIDTTVSGSWVTMVSLGSIANNRFVVITGITNGPTELNGIPFKVTNIDSA
jgi:hypothetical protein